MLGNVRDSIMTAGKDAPAVEFPAAKTIAAQRFLADPAVPYGDVFYDYNKDA